MIPVQILTQPNDSTCGPTCLHAVYQYFQDNISLDQVIREVATLDDGGTLAVFLGCHALERGYEATIYTYNLKVFDPTWFLPGVDLVAKLQEQKKFKKSLMLRKASRGYIEFLERGGNICLENLSADLLRRYFDQSVPILTGLSATYLYQCEREMTDDQQRQVSDDLRGVPVGHFVVLCGYDEETQNIIIADPFHENPVSLNNYYSVKDDRLINSIMLGIMTYDVNLLVIQPKP